MRHLHVQDLPSRAVSFLSAIIKGDRFLSPRYASNARNVELPERTLSRKEELEEVSVQTIKSGRL